MVLSTQTSERDRRPSGAGDLACLSREYGTVTSPASLNAESPLYVMMVVPMGFWRFQVTGPPKQGVIV